MRVIVKGEVEIWKRLKRIPMQSVKVIESLSEEEIIFIGVHRGKLHFYINYLHLMNHS
jgi:hypothetical protein